MAQKVPFSYRGHPNPIQFAPEFGSIYDNLSIPLRSRYASLQPGIEAPGGLDLPRVEGRLTLRDVTFSYPTRPEQRVLDGFR
jgi:hypothetical protein